MNNLHRIKWSTLTLTELAVLYYAEKFSTIGYKFKIKNGKLYFAYRNTGVYGDEWNLTTNWNIPVVMSYWKAAGNPMPDFSILEK